MQRIVVVCSNVERYLQQLYNTDFSDIGKISNVAFVDILRYVVPFNVWRKKWITYAITNRKDRWRNIKYLCPKLHNQLSIWYSPSIRWLIKEWKFRSYDKVFSLICLGMGESSTSNKPPNGRIVIITCRLSSSNKRAVRTKLIRPFLTKQPVYAIAKLDERYFIMNYRLTSVVWCIHGEIL